MFEESKIIENFIQYQYENDGDARGTIYGKLDISIQYIESFDSKHPLLVIIQQGNFVFSIPRGHSQA